MTVPAIGCVDAPTDLRGLLCAALWAIQFREV
jgi:hypothetical protein